MNSGIFPIHNNEELVEVNEHSYDSEKLLQSWVGEVSGAVGGESD